MQADGAKAGGSHSQAPATSLQGRSAEAAAPGAAQEAKEAVGGMQGVAPPAEEVLAGESYIPMLALCRILGEGWGKSGLH